MERESREVGRAHVPEREARSHDEHGPFRRRESVTGDRRRELEAPEEEDHAEDGHWEQAEERAQDGPASHERDVLEDEAQAKTQDDASYDRPRGQSREPRYGAGDSHHEPENPSGEGRRPEHPRRHRAGVGDRGRGDRLHGLHRYRRPEVEAAHDPNEAEAEQDALGVESIDRDVADDERDERAEVAERSGGLAERVLVAAELQGVVWRNAAPQRRSTARSSRARKTA